MQLQSFRFFRLLWALVPMVLSTVTPAVAGDASASQLKGDIEWPGQWTVFAPLSESDVLADPAQLKAVPQRPRRLRTVGRGDVDGEVKETKGVRLEVQPGDVVDLTKFFKRQSPRNVAYVFLELESPTDQVVTFGFGADWWMEAWINGDPVEGSTLADGNLEWPISMTNHAVDLPLRAGNNVLVVRFLTGSASSALALGGPREYPAAERHLQRELARDLNTFQDALEDRQIFPQDVQATIMAERGLQLPQTNADLAAGELAGLQAMPEMQFFRRGENVINPRFNEPVKIRLSKYRYPFEDRHLDAIVWLTPKSEDDPVKGSIEVLLKAADGTILSRNTADKLSPSGVFFAVGFPPQVQDSAATLEVIWSVDGKEVGRSEEELVVGAPTGVATSGRVPLRILNDPAATVSSMPMTVGVPFPRGALASPANVRLVDESGKEQPLQVRESGRWSRFGPVKWLLCDFTVDLAGEPREWFLEYGPQVKRAPQEAVGLITGETGFPDISAGRLQVRNGVVAYDFSGDGSYEKLLEAGALSGAFVKHEQRGSFLVPADSSHSIEEIGPAKVLVRRTGWYVNPDTGEKFCQYVTRLAFFHDSPVVRIFHTWIYTGDSNHDRIAEMGWLFQSAGEPQDGEILTAFDGGEWLRQPSLVQFDYQHFLLPASGEEFSGRTPGVASWLQDSGRVTFGTKDFWQNFPNELAFDEGGLAFYNWPRRNPPARFERPVTVDKAYLLRFAHEGEVLDFRMPDEYAERAIWNSATRGAGRDIDWQGTHYPEDRPDQANAQGIARTEEMFLFLAPAAAPLENSAKVMQGMNDETLRAVVDPKWMAETLVFGPVHPLDTERFAEEERLYELVVEAPPKWVERLGTYGKWLYGDYPSWNLNLSTPSIQNYRAFHKMGHNYPMRSLAYVRTGNPKFFKLAENAARQLSDASFCHYASSDVDATMERPFFRNQGLLGGMSIFPWASKKGPRNRGIVIDTDFLWDNYYLTGYTRARDVALLLGELTKEDVEIIPATRHSQSSLHSYLDIWQATFDPWFLNAAHEIASVLVQAFGGEYEMDPLTSTPARDVTGYDHWRAADQAFYNYTGRRDYRNNAVNSAISQSNPRNSVVGAGASPDGGIASRHAAYAWHLTGEPFFLRRMAASLDYLRVATWEGDIEHFQGIPPSGHGTAPLDVARTLPLHMAVLAELDEEPEPIHSAVWIAPQRPAMTFPPIHVHHDGNGPLRLSLDARGGGIAREDVDLRIDGPQGTVIDGVVETSDEPIELDVPAGTYTVRMTSSNNLFIPLTQPDHPEVIEFERTESGTETKGGMLGYWFMVPKGVTEFSVRYATPSGGRWPVHRLSVWNPNGERAWNQFAHNDDLPVEVVIPVPPGQDGKLWRATGGNVVVDPQIPPYFSISRSKWFNPESQLNSSLHSCE